MGGYSGNAGDSLDRHDGIKWTATDQDNDGFWVGGNCADAFGPNWHVYCCNACPLNKANSRFWRTFVDGGIDTMKWMIR